MPRKKRGGADKPALKVDPHAGWLKSGLQKDGKSQRGLAKFLDIDDATVHRMINGGRTIRHDELQKIAVYLGEPIPSGEVKTVPVRGVLIEGAWRIKMQEQVVKPSQDKVVAIPHRIAAECQFAYEIVMPGHPTQVEYFVSPDDLGRDVREGDKVLVQETRGDMVRDFEGTVKRAAMGLVVMGTAEANTGIALAGLLLLGVSLGVFIPRDV